MIDLAKNETPEEKTFRYLKRYSKKVIQQVVTEFLRKNESLLFICKQDAIRDSEDRIKKLNSDFKTQEERMKYEIHYAEEWEFRSKIRKNIIYPAMFEDAIEKRVWQYGWTYNDLKEEKVNGAK